MSSRRVETGGLIDRSRSVHFTFDGRGYSGHFGDTLASALLANGVTLTGRSFKYHRPRGIFSAGVDEPNALVTVVKDGTREPNLPATQVELYEGLTAESQNRFPSLAFDVGALNRPAAPLFSAGFYYKTFMGPVIGPLRGTRFWMFCEHFIRRAAGLGRAGYEKDPASYERMYAFCDVLVVGAGPAGLAAAEAAAKDGGRVILVEQDASLGGTSRWSAETISGKSASAWSQTVADRLAGMENVRILPRTTAWGYYDGNNIAALERVGDHLPERPKGTPRHRHWSIHAGKVVLATGAFERPIIFPDNDRPGVMLAGAAQRFAAEYGVLPGEKIAVFTNNDSAYQAAAILKETGAAIMAIIDVRPEISQAAETLARKAGVAPLLGHAVVGTSGKCLSKIQVQRFDAVTGLLSGDTRPIDVDCLAVSGGWSPAIHLASQAGGRPAWDGRHCVFLPPEPSQEWLGAGAFSGFADTAAALKSGRDAGLSAIGKRPSRAKLPEVGGPALDPHPAPVFQIRADGKAFVDLQHDVTVSDLRLAHREGFGSAEHLKRYTTLGMATDQGKTSNVPGLAVMAHERGLPMQEVGTTRFRPPFTPVSIGSLAAERHRHFRPDRLTPMHDWHVERGTRMTAAGLWHRPMYYGQPGETLEQAYTREAASVRRSVGIVDVSTLGKIAVKGPDAAEFLDRLYTNNFSTLPIGKARYGLMLREDGFAFDDGTTWHLGEYDFLMTTTTANAGKVMQHLEYFLDIVWPELRVHLTSVTDQWAGAAIAGQSARKVLTACVTGTAVDNETLPPMSIVHGQIEDVPVMICRLSFSGELAYEVYCGAGHGEYVWEALMAAGEPYGITPYGMEALGALRIEKGHVTGAEIDGRTTARDLYLNWMLSKTKPFIGSALMDRPGLIDRNRLRLVGIVSLDGQPLGGGAQIVEDGNLTELGKSIGHVTASCYSPALSKFIGLALVESGKERYGKRAYVSDPLRKRFGPVEIVSHHFYDPEGKRMHA